MRKFLAFLLVLSLAHSQVQAAFVDALVTITNAAHTGTNYTINGSTRTATNAQTATTFITNATSVNHTATNLVAQYRAYPIAGLSFRWASTNSFYFSGTNVVLSFPGAWASVVYVTNSGPKTWPLVGPPASVTETTNRQNFANWIVEFLNDYNPTNALKTNNAAMVNYATLTTGQTLSNKTVRASVLEDSRLTNAIIHATNSFLSNVTAHTITMTNGANYGNAFSSPGTASGSEQFGSGATSSGPNTTTLGSSAAGQGTNQTVIGYQAQGYPTATRAIVVGSTAYADLDAEDGITIGTGSSVNAPNAIAMGNGAASYFINSIALGNSSTTTASNQIMVGASTHTVEVPGILRAEKTTNSTWTGTNTLRGDLAVPVNHNGSLTVGHNADVVLTNVWTKFGVAGGAFTNAGFFHPRMVDGLRVKITNTNGFPMALLNESGLESTDTRRIRTGTGGTIVITNNPGNAWLYYDTDLNRWCIESHSN